MGQRLGKEAIPGDSGGRMGPGLGAAEEVKNRTGLDILTQFLNSCWEIYLDLKKS